MTYYTFRRAARNWDEFASSSKTVVRRGLSYEEARATCQEYNRSRTPQQVARGVKLEFSSER